ncbi:MAG TPA: YicC/YloC family endoribonuclease [Candidatus Eisenbacteria bacterium]|nr:YicC/YloC family endoribonuclease [Candidatus Eisenbacteria bacterium]
MLRSMTGYGRGETVAEGLRLTAELRSVNHRFCELSVRLPRTLAAYEAEARKIVQEKMTRGKLSLIVAWGNDGAETEEPGGTLTLDRKTADRYLQLLNEAKSAYHLKGDLDVNAFVGLSNVFVWQETARNPEFYLGLLRTVVEQATADLLRMKEQEGAHLKKDFEERLEGLRSRVATVRERAPQRVRETFEKTRERVKTLLEGHAFPEERVVQEIALLSDRLDCTEECVRLEAHCAQFRRYLEEEATPGRKLNFLLQEMNREINTIGSKSNDVAIVEQVVEVKEELERIREQVQNIE